METKLTEFNKHQLQHALDEIVAGILRLESFPCIKDYIKYGKVAVYNSEDYRTMVRYQNLCLWRTQLLTAIGIVQRREQIANT